MKNHASFGQRHERRRKWGNRRAVRLSPTEHIESPALRSGILFEIRMEIFGVLMLFIAFTYG
jgi:hypothetical protein